MGSYKLEPLTSIAPSKVEALNLCAYQVALSANARRLKLPILPPSPYAIMGQLVHRMYQGIYAREILSAADFENSWVTYERQLENKFYNGTNGVLKQHVTDYIIKKLTCKKVIPESHRSTWQNAQETKVITEKRFFSSSGRVIGIADLIIETSHEVKIIDHKTGKVLDKNGKLKEAYRKQLLLYAHLYFRANGKYPDILIIRDLFGKNFTVPFTAKDCASLYDWVLTKLDDINNFILNGDSGNQSIANPSVELCKSCDVRVSCPYYLNLSPKASIDLKATSIAKRIISNKLNVIVLVNGKQKAIQGFRSFPDYMINRDVLFFNLKLDYNGIYKAGYNTAFTGLDNQP